MTSYSVVNEDGSTDVVVAHSVSFDDGVLAFYDTNFNLLIAYKQWQQVYKTQ
jgi:hypothetical protein